jgi:hypothetical protein
MKLLIIAALIAGSVTAAAAEDYTDRFNAALKFRIILAKGEIIDKTPTTENGASYLIVFENELYGCIWLPAFHGDCVILKSANIPRD